MHLVEGCAETVNPLCRERQPFGVGFVFEFLVLDLHYTYVLPTGAG